MEGDERKGCDGHCDRCTPNQRSYCAAQLAYYNMREISAIRADLAKISSGDEPFIIHDMKVEEKAEEADSEA